MNIKSSSGKILAHSLGKSVLQIKNANAMLVGRDYSIRLENPSDPADSITVVVENGEFMLENIKNGGKKNAKTNKKKSKKDEADGGGEDKQADDKSKDKKPDGEDKNGSSSKSSEERGEGDDGEGKAGDGENGEGDGGKDKKTGSDPGSSRKYTVK